LADDLEAVGNLMIYFLKLDLPWISKAVAPKRNEESLAVFNKISALRSPEKICEGIEDAVELTKYMTYVQNLNRNEIPDYSYLQHLLFNLIR
jgi:hypothetical protein